MALGEDGGDEHVILLDLDGDDAPLADIGEVSEVRLLHDAATGGKEDVLLGIPGGLHTACTAAGGRLDPHGGGDLLAGLEVQDIGDRFSLGRAAHLGNLVDALDIAAACLGEEDEIVVRAGGEEVLDEVIILGVVLRLLGSHADDPLATALLGAVRADGRSLDEPLVGDCDDASLVGDEVLDGDLPLLRNELGETGAGMLVPDGLQLGLDDREDALLAGKDVEEVLDGLEKLLILVVELVTLEPGQLVETQLKDGVGLRLAEAVLALVVETGLVAQEDAELLDFLLAEAERQQTGAGLVAVLRVADDLDEVIKVRQGDEVALELLGAGLGLAEEEAGAAQDDLAAVLNEAGDRLLEREKLRTSPVDGQHRDGEGGLERGVLVEIVDHHLGDGVALQLDDHAGVLVRLVADGADVGDNLLVHQPRDALDEGGAVDVVGDLGDDDLLPTTLDLLDAGASADLDRTASGLEVLPDAADAAELAARREVGPLDVLHQLVDRDVGVVDLGADCVNGLAEVVRRDVGRHADGDAGAAVDKEVWDRGGEYCRLLAGVVVVRDEVDGVVVHVLHEDGAEGSQTGLGVTHGGRRIAFHGSEVTLPLDEGLSHGPGLGHVDEGRVDRLVAVGVVVTHRLADDLRALEVLACRHDSELAHREEDASLGGLQAVAGIGKGAGNDDRHGVVEEGSRDLFGDIDRFDFFVLVIQGIGPPGRFGV